MRDNNYKRNQCDFERVQFRVIFQGFNDFVQGSSWNNIFVLKLSLSQNQTLMIGECINCDTMLSTTHTHKKLIHTYIKSCLICIYFVCMYVYITYSEGEWAPFLEGLKQM